MKCDAQIAILMATYNGERFLREQMDSILSQTFKDWHLYVHDDGSKDSTLDILNEYVEKYPDRITVMDYPSQGGACKNFLSMLERVDAPYYMFCDQDDVWLPEKVALTYFRMGEEESRSANAPVIVHSDLCLVNEKLNTVSSSFIRNQRIKIERIKSFEDYAATNTVTGCAMMLNTEAKGCVRHPYSKAIMHDAWICLSVVAQGGIVSFIDKPLIKYRQHGDNSLGALRMDEMTLYNKIKNIRNIFASIVAHYEEMNAVRPITIVDFIKSRIRYRRR